MKRLFCFVLALLVLASLWGCAGSAPVIAKADLQVYHLLSEETFGEAKLTVTGNWPDEETEGEFDGQVVIKEKGEKSHTYDELQFVQTDNILVLYQLSNDGMDAAYKCVGVLDLDAPEKAMFAVFDWEAETTEIMVTLDRGITALEARALGTKINQIEYVVSAEYVSGEEALEMFISDHDLDAMVFAGVDEDRLADRYFITVDKPANAQQVIEEVTIYSAVENIHYGSELLSTKILAPDMDYEQILELLSEAYAAIS